MSGNGGTNGKGEEGEKELSSQGPGMTTFQRSSMGEISYKKKLWHAKEQKEGIDLNSSRNVQ